jgi:membrane protein
VSRPGDEQEPQPRLNSEGRARALKAALQERAPGWMFWARDHIPGVEPLFGALIREAASGGVLIAGGLAFRLFLWLVPLGLLGAVVLSFWTSADEEGLSEAAGEFGIGAASIRVASDALQTSPTNRAVLLVAALLLTLWFSLGVVRALVLAFSLAWRLEPRRLSRPFLAVGLFDGIIVFVALGPLALAWLREQIGLGGLVGVVATLALDTAIVVFVTSLLPHRAERWQGLLPGAVLVAVGTQLMQIAVVFYFAPKLERSSEFYGALGTAAAILLWLYFSARLLTFSAFLNATLWDRQHGVAAGVEAPVAAGTRAQASTE